jgi:hypothetical protein
MSTNNCHDVVARLDELVDGSLDAKETEMITAHLERCASCRSELEQLEDLLLHTRELPGSIEPENDLWPAIRSAIEERRVVRGTFGGPGLGSGRRAWLAAAAAAVLVLSVTVAYLAGRGHAPVEQASNVAPGPSVITAAYTDLDDDLGTVTAELRQRLESRRDELSPETWSVVMDNLLVIDNAIVRIETALAEQPDDGRLSRQLAVAYRRQIDLLERATKLPAEV